MHTTPIKIKPATPADAPGIAAVKSRVWPAETADPARISTAITDPAHAAFVAVDGETVVGFADGFSTRSREGQNRWEVDLLAVDPDYQGRKLGFRLVEACTLAGRERGAILARGLIHIENIASQKTFARYGYTVDETICNLRVCTEATPSPVAPPDGLHLLVVNTFGYRGLWLEGDLSEAGFIAAKSTLCAGQHDVAGAIIPAAQTEINAIAEEQGFEPVGTYQWWKLNLED